MIPLADYHVHTTFCDGKNTPEEMVRAAIEKGMSAIGFSGHSPLPRYGESWCMTEESAARYRAEIARLKEKYADKIKILCGVEQDFCSETPTEDYDYVIGSVHILNFNDAWAPVDYTAQAQLTAAERFCGGDMYALGEAYYRTVSEVVEKTNCDIIGHFDLMSKFNEGNRLFDEQHPRYIAAWQAAADKLLRSGKPFEINTGGISRGYRSVPYPAPEIQDYLAARGAKFVLSGDAHSADTLCYQFDRWERA